MADHLSIATIGCPDRSALARLEEEVLSLLAPPLNLMGMIRTPARLRLMKLRSSLKASPRKDAEGEEDTLIKVEQLPGGPEAHLDLLLAEELAVNPDLVAWLLGLGSDAEISSDDVMLNVWHDGQDCCGTVNSGENDLEVHLRIDGEQQVILIEDKLWAEFQPEQARRYRRRADFHGAHALLVSPRSRLTDATHRQHFDAVSSIEDVADWLASRAAKVDGELATASNGRRRGFGRSPCGAGSSRGLRTLPPSPLRRSASGGCGSMPPTSSPTRPHFGRLARLAVVHPSTGAGLQVHPRAGRSLRHHQRVRGTVTDLAKDLEEAGGPPAFAAASDTKDNPVVRWQGQSVNPADGVPIDPTPAIRALEHCVLAARWLAQQPWAASSGPS